MIRAASIVRVPITLKAVIKDRSRGRVSHIPADSTPGATHSPRDHIATEGHTAVVPEKQHTE